MRAAELIRGNLLLIMLVFFATLEGHMAEAQAEKFAMIAVQERDAGFAFAESALDFHTVSPDGFVWNNSTEVPPDFIPSAMFTEFQQRYIGYEPLNRDRLEIRVFSARIHHDRVALATDYARLMASRWGRTNFGLMAHSPTFGEVLRGDNSSGVMVVSRISVFRRGDELLIVRTKFHAEHFGSYADQIARFIGSIAFDHDLQADPIANAFLWHDQNVGSGQAQFVFPRPGNWQLTPPGQQTIDGGTYSFWRDVNDPNGNAAMMVATIPPLGRLPEGSVAAPEPQEMANLAAALANMMLSNMLPDQPFRLEPVEKNSFATLNEITAFNANFTFRAIIGEEGVSAALPVMLTMGPDGSVIANVTLSPAPEDLYLLGTGMHVNFVQALFLDAIKSHFGNRGADSN